LALSPPPEKEVDRGGGDYWCCTVLLQRGISAIVAGPPPAKGDQRGRGLVRETILCFVNGNIFLFSAPRPCPAKGDEFLLALAKGEKCYWRRALLLQRRGIEDWGSYLCCSVLLQRGLSFYWRSTLFLQILEQRGRGLVRKTFFCFVNGNIFLLSTPRRKHILILHTYFYSFQLVISSLTPVDHLNFTLTQVPQHGSTIKEEEIKQQTGRV
jgi:hypothetical protein